MLVPDRGDEETAAPATEPRIFAIDTRPLLRSGLARLARRALGCGAHTLADLDQAYAAIQLVDSQPRVVLIGVRAGDDPEQVVTQARELGAPVILVLDAADPALERAALAAQADGYVVAADADSDTLRRTVEAAEAGERYIPDELRERGGHEQAISTITARCLEVLRGLSEGLHDHEIAGRMGISTSAVRKHISGAQERLQARTRTQVVAMVARNGLL
jgi:DNA-binding NarL/FixJ family response regulator